jgi:hypothetical protein
MEAPHIFDDLGDGLTGWFSSLFFWIPNGIKSVLLDIFHVGIIIMVIKDQCVYFFA